VSREGQVLVIDPSWTREEINRIHDHALSYDGPIHLLLTHADCDHICGFGLFPEAQIIVERKSAELINNGTAEAQLLGALAEWDNHEPPVNLRFDHVFDAGDELKFGPFQIATFHAPGHVLDGVVFNLLDEKLMVVGDYLCSTFGPLISGSISAYRHTTERICRSLVQYKPRWIIPGHGPLLSFADATEMAQDDLRYLEKIEKQAAFARENHLSYGHSLVMLLDIEPPRTSKADIEIYSPRLLIARTALHEAGMDRPEEAVKVWGP
jgi:glyoxylase-like metal-dependent hydrolase (beta-lactamase superfamily II)